MMLTLKNNFLVFFFLLSSLFFLSACVNKHISPHDTEFVQDTLRTKDGVSISIIDNKYVEFFTQKISDTFKLYTKEEHIFAIALSSNEKYFAIASGAKNSSSIIIYDYKTKAILNTSKLNINNVKKIEFSSDSKYIIVASDNALTILNASDLIEKIVFKAISPHGIAMIKDKTGYKIFSVGFDKKISLHTYDERANKISFIKEYTTAYRLKYLSYNEEKKELVVCGENYEVMVLSLDLQVIKTLKLSFVPHRLRLNKDTTRLFIAGGRFSSSAVSYSTVDYEPFY